ncbi:MAG TPA: transporter [Acidobacteriota bacterium]|nr:transporter [Acidobacteriota bacterium]HND20925.1 transporter [Acidobacteriota bacterium]HNG91334.1 transporter [Acidobacteriota bacterium]
MTHHLLLFSFKPINLTRQGTLRLMQLIGLVCFWLVMSPGVQAQQRPLLTEDVDIIPPGKVRAQLGVEFLQDQRFGLSGLRGDVTRAGWAGLHFGLSSNVSFSVEGVMRNFLNIHETGPSPIPLSIAPGATSTSDFGDLTLSTKVKLRNEGKRMPSLGFKLGVTLPNSDQARGIGTNTLNLFATTLVGKNFLNGRLRTFGNIGMGILADTLDARAQQDVLLYGVAGILKVNERLNLLGEVNGRYNPRRAKPGLESQSQARFGMQLKAGGFQWDVAAIKGLTDFSPQSGVSLGVTYDFKAFEPVK